MGDRVGGDDGDAVPDAWIRGALVILTAEVSIDDDDDDDRDGVDVIASTNAVENVSPELSYNID